MKKLFTILTVVILTTTISFAQSGTVAIGVGSNLANEAWQDYHLIPTVGYFVSDAIMVGTGFSMGSSSEEEVDISSLTKTSSEGSSFEMSPFLRFYLSEAFYASVGIAIGSGSTESTSTSSVSAGDWNKSETSSSTFGLNAGVGYSLMWNDRICIEPSFGIATGSGSGTSNSSSATGGVLSTNPAADYDEPTTFGMAIGLGIHIRLGGDE